MLHMLRKFFNYKTALSASLSHIEELFSEVTRAYRSKNSEQVIALCERVLALSPGHVEAYYMRANALKDLQQLLPALADYDKAVDLKPDFAHAWCNRGVVLQSLGSYETALESYDRAIALDSSDALVHANRASLLQAMSRWNLALGSCDLALERNPRLFQVWFHRGNVLRELQLPDAALASYREALKLQPDYAEAHYNCGVLLERAQQPQLALACYEAAIAIYPEFFQAHFNRAGLLKAIRGSEAALAAYDCAIAAHGAYAEAYANRGVVLQELGRRQAALENYERAIALRPDYAEAYFNRGTVLSELRQRDAALASYDHAISLKPDYAAAYCDRARVLLQLKRLDEAIVDYIYATVIQPDFAEAQYNKSLAFLLNGDFERGWLYYEWRWKNTDRLFLREARIFRQPLWLGKECVAGKRVLIHCEQGYGDTLQFCRFAAVVEGLGATVLLEVQAPLAILLESLAGVSQVIGQGSPLPEYDFQCPIMSLPLALNIRIDTIPTAISYVHSERVNIERWRARLGPLLRPRVGLAWSGNPNLADDRNRSISLGEWVAHLPSEFEYVVLQKEIRRADSDVLDAHPRILRFDAELADFSDTAALCECVDLVVSVDTSIAHLSGALGKPTWVLLPFSPDWRWLLDRDDSPWYPAVKLYRQQAIGDWSGVLARIVDDLRTGAVTGDFSR